MYEMLCSVLIAIALSYFINFRFKSSLRLYSLSNSCIEELESC